MLLNFYRFLICLLILIGVGLVGLGVSVHDNFFLGVACLFFISAALAFIDYKNKNIDTFRKF